MTPVRLVAAVLVAALLPVLAPAGPASGAGPGAGAPRNRPDLTVRSLSVYTTADAVSATMTVKNAGRGKAKASQAAYYLSGDGTLTAASRGIAMTAVSKLRRHRATSVTMAVTLPGDVAPGSYALFACVDVGRKVRERNEKNNCRKADDLVVVTGAATPHTNPTNPTTTPPVTQVPVPPTTSVTVRWAVSRGLTGALGTVSPSVSSGSCSSSGSSGSCTLGPGAALTLTATATAPLFAVKRWVADSGGRCDGAASGSRLVFSSPPAGNQDCLAQITLLGL